MVGQIGLFLDLVLPICCQIGHRDDLHAALPPEVEGRSRDASCGGKFGWLTMTRGQHPIAFEAWIDRVELDDMFRDAKPVGATSFA